MSNITFVLYAFVAIAHACVPCGVGSIVEQAQLVSWPSVVRSD